MHVFKTRWGRGLGLGLCLALCTGLWASSLADVVHFANGNSVRGKLDRLTGDIIEFRRSKHFLGNLDYFKRIQLTDRHDVAETRDGEKYFGEIIYLDDFILEIQTASGAVRIKRIALVNVVLGSPSQAPNIPAMKQMMPPEPPSADEPSVRTTPMTTISNTKATKQWPNPLNTPDPGEDEDAIPAVDSDYRR